MKKFITLFLFSTFLFSVTAYSSDYEIDLTPFENMYSIDVGELVKPTVVSVQLPTTQYYSIAIIEEDKVSTAQPYLAIRKEKEKSFNVTSASAIRGSSSYLFDENFVTTTEFDLDKDEGFAFIEFESNEEITSDQLRLSLDNNVALPYEIALYADVDNDWKTVIANSKLYSSLISFPKTESKKWKLELKHSQPLIVREIVLSDIGADNVSDSVEIRWLARSGMEYKIYTDPATYVSIPTSEKGNLDGEDLEVKYLDLGSASFNPLFKEPDYDNDGVPDVKDNCVKLSNPLQTDNDKNNKGDDCEDDDGDDVLNSTDNCPEHPNYSQRDEDKDGIGDECDDEESRITEKNKWLPWLVLTVSGVVLLMLILSTLKKEK